MESELLNYLKCLIRGHRKVIDLPCGLTEYDKGCLSCRSVFTKDDGEWVTACVTIDDCVYNYKDVMRKWNPWRNFPYMIILFEYDA